jgi:hypothetical protein
MRRSSGPSDIQEQGVRAGRPTGIADVSLPFPGSLLDPMWRQFGRLEFWSIVLMASVSLACGSCAFGLWKGARWGHPAALGPLAIDLMGDFLNALFGAEPRALVGVLVAGALIAYLMTGRVRLLFTRATR